MEKFRFGPSWTGVDTSNWVYHYTTLAKAMEYILPSGTLRLGSFDSVNDPREAKQFKFQGAGEGASFLDSAKSAPEFLKRQCKVLCTVRDQPDAEPGAGELGRGFARPRMWAQYADAHTGVCLALNKRKLHESIEAAMRADEMLFCGAVQYRDWHINEYNAFNLDLRKIADSSIDEYMTEMLQKNFESYYLVKYADWASELEWRWVVKGVDDAPVYVSIRGALEAIIVGDQFHDSYVPAIRPYAEKFEADLTRLVWFLGQPQIVPLPKPST